MSKDVIKEKLEKLYPYSEEKHLDLNDLSKWVEVVDLQRDAYLKGCEDGLSVAQELIKQLNG